MIKRLLILSILLTAIVLAIVTRFYKLGTAPAGLYLDEAGQGYNAYSILKTGRDEFGKSFPFVFRSFIDFKTPVYVYLIVPLIPFFDLTPLTVRLPSFIFSILTLPILFLLLRKLSPPKLAIPLSLLSTLLLAISPWHILFGRTNFECNVALFFFLAGVYFFYKSLAKPIWLIPAAALFAVAIPAYHSQRIVTPAILIFLLIRYRQKLLAKNFRPFLILSLAIGLIISLPTISIMFTPGFLARAAGLNIFSSPHPAGFLDNYHGWWEWLVNNRIFLSTWEFASLYVSYLSPRDMFLLGDYGPRSSFPELATFYLWQFPFYLYGIYLLIKNKTLGELRTFLMAFLLIAPIPAALTRDPYSTIRALPLVIPQLTIIALGMIFFWQKFSSKLWRWGMMIALAIIVFYSLTKLYSSVIILNEFFRAKYWDYGWQKVVEVIQRDLDPKLPIVVDNSRFEPYSQLVFFLKYDPLKYQHDNYEVPLNEYYANMNRNRTKIIGNIITRAIDWEHDLLAEQYLIGDELSISYTQIKEHNLTLISEILYPDRSVAYRIVKIKK
ncbi:glycosyltransferase family 39 protein [Candidatus Microgenomates bacterium]|nr:glycosyltransferase family 39 protein [Candidatus Microgenomates bacterium]